MSSKSSTNAGKHLYQKLNFWVNGTLSFWRDKHPGSLQSYNVPEYEKRLQEEIKHHRNYSTLK